jgi:hypothetical protein
VFGFLREAYQDEKCRFSERQMLVDICVY